MRHEPYQKAYYIIDIESKKVFYNGKLVIKKLTREDKCQPLYEPHDEIKDFYYNRYRGNKNYL